ncbi:rCG28495, isoform CRA_b [Rattus norvegicus]|uniref:RCG28495, isoform CRA_b n=1 Tax=Rattus norvegicus TaxID=10116 RepID=A6HW06_RAT|nr:rCG28495, isoform CRA_b [Rattus norvegicus]
MVATGSLSSKNTASISELLDGGSHPGSLLSGESPGCPPLSYPKVAAPL